MKEDKNSGWLFVIIFWLVIIILMVDGTTTIGQVFLKLGETLITFVIVIFSIFTIIWILGRIQR